MHRVGGTGTDRPDPDYAPTVEIFDQMPYEDIYRGVRQLDPEVLTAGRQAWQSAAAGVGDAVQQAHAEIRGAVADGWRGAAAQQAVGAMQAFEELGQHVADVMSAVAQRLGQANDAAETLRAAVSRPTSVSPDLQAALLDPKRATLNVAAEKQAEGVRQDIVRVMHTVYAGAFLPTGNGVPAFHEGGMYPSAPAPAPAPGENRPPDATDSVAGPPASGAVANSAPARPEGVAEMPPAERDSAGAADSDGPDAQESPAPPATAPAAATTPASAAPAAAAPGGASASVADRPAATQPASVANAVAPQPGRVAPAAVASPAAVPAGAASAAATTPQSSEDNRKRDERNQQRHEPSGDPIGGMGAGIVGGLAGGAFAAAGDTVRSGPGVPVPPKRSPDDEDDDEYYDFEEPTFLDPAEPGNDLVGQFDPTTPPVVGEWAEDY